VTQSLLFFDPPQPIAVARPPAISTSPHRHDLGAVHPRAKGLKIIGLELGIAQAFHSLGFLVSTQA